MAWDSRMNEEEEDYIYENLVEEEFRETARIIKTSVSVQFSFELVKLFY